MAASTLRCRYCRRPATHTVRATGGSGQLLSTAFAICDRGVCVDRWHVHAQQFRTVAAPQPIPDPARAGPDDPTNQPALF